RDGSHRRRIAPRATSRAGRPRPFQRSRSRIDGAVVARRGRCGGGWLVVRRALAHALLACAGIVSALVLVEMSLRLALPGGRGLQVQWGMPDDAVESRAHRDSREATGTYTYDDDGFRVGSGLPYDRSILFIGDSFTEGRGVSDDETFARATERTMRRDGV